MLYQLSYAPVLSAGLPSECSHVRGYAPRVQRRLLGLLFAALAAGLGGVAIYSALAGGRAWVLAAAAAALAVWMGGLALRALR